jgi:putative ABC transport system ATP-binding protein
MSLIKIQDVTKDYKLGDVTVHALRRVDLTIAKGEFTAIWGPSGSGKTSLLNLIALVDQPTTGSLTLAGVPTDAMSDEALSDLRNDKIGIVFQGFNLISVLNATDNVALPLRIRGVDATTARAAAIQRLKMVGLGDHLAHRPDQMSGGQRQRVAIARALVVDPDVVVADEPTAALDSNTSREIIDLMRHLNRTAGVTFLFSTHDVRLLSRVDRKIQLEDGKIVEDIVLAVTPSAAEGVA